MTQEQVGMVWRCLRCFYGCQLSAMALRVQMF